MNTLEQAPAWLLRPLPTNANVDAKLNERIAKLSEGLPDNLLQIEDALNRVHSFAEYDVAANVASACIWKSLDRFFLSRSAGDRTGLLSFAGRHMSEEALARICRRLAKDPEHRVRLAARRIIEP